MSSKQKLLFIGVDQAITYLLKKFLDEESLPNISNLVNNGVIGEALSCPPCDTPTNWATIATGATTSVHGATSFYMHIPSEPFELGLQQRSRTQLSRYCQAEYLWDVADKNDLVPFVINYPAGWPRQFNKGAMSLFTWPIPQSLPRIISPAIPITFTSDSKTPALQISRADDYDSELKSHSPPLQLSQTIVHGAIEKPYNFKSYIIDSIGEGYDSLILSIGLPKEWQKLKIGDSSDWISIDLTTDHGILPCLYKIKVLELLKDGSLLKIQRTGIYNTKGWTQPESLGEQLIKNMMIYEPPEKHEVEYMIQGEVEPFLLYARKEAVSLAQAITYAKQNIGWQVCFFHIHHLDAVNHKALALLHKKSPLYTEEGENHVSENVRVAYKIVDELVGSLVKSCVDDETIIVLVADHGAVPVWKIANIPLALMDAGLLAYKWNEISKKFVVDWQKTVAFPYLEPPYIWVNLKGRDPQGIVESADFESVRDAIIRTLNAMKDPETGAKIVKLAINKEDAEHLGQNGERIGDVVFFLNPPYQIFDGNLNQLNAAEQTKRSLKNPMTYDAKRCFGAHAYYLPTEKFGNFSNTCPLILNGPGVKKGVELKKTVDLIDIAPTLAKLLKIPKPRNSQGRILHEAIE